MMWHWTDVPNWVITAYGSVSGGKQTAQQCFMIFKCRVKTSIQIRIPILGSWRHHLKNGNFFKVWNLQKFQWNFVYFWSKNYYGWMSLLFWKGRRSEMDFMLFTAEWSLVESLCCPEEWHCITELKSCETLTQSFFYIAMITYLDTCSIHTYYRGPSQELLLMLWDCFISACWFSRQPSEKYYNFIKEKINFKQNE